MGRPKQQSDEEILKVAKECFVLQGPGVSTTVIAERAGISQASLFKRFGTKEELMIRALIPYDRPPWTEQVEKGPDPNRDDLPEQLLEITRLLWTFIKDMTPRISALRASGVPFECFCKRFKTPPPIHGQRAIANWFRIAEQQGRILGSNPDHLALILTSALHGRCFFKHTLGQRFTKQDDEAYLESLADLLWKSIAPKNEK